MKIAGLTFHNSSNYGAVLQTFALQEIVINLGHEYVIINYANSEKKKFDSVLGRNKEMSLFHYVYKLLSFPYSVYQKRKFLLFTDKFLNLTPEYQNIEDLRSLEKYVNRFICGSDQIWNAEMIRYDPAYFLSFVSEREKKISYAASFGKASLNKKEEKFYIEMLKGIDKISVREQSGLKIVEQCSGKKAEVVLDPTLLLNAEQWRKIATFRIGLKPYILAYVLYYDPVIQDFLHKLHRQTGLKIVYIARGVASFFREGANIIPSPEEWVGLFLQASYVVTTSFHGTVFSTNFNRPFFTFIKGNGSLATNSRIVDFLSLTGLEERLHTKCPEGEIDLTLPKFDQANCKLARLREKSIKYLIDSIDMVGK